MGGGAASPPVLHMSYVVPDYYGEFFCIAGACRHSCCIGWEIDIDGESLESYRALPGEMGKRIRENIESGEDSAHFRLGEGERCPFLNSDGLCDMILELGEESLCQICADHPRFRNFIGDREEVGLGLCCEAAGRLILGKKEPMQLLISGEEELDAEAEELISLRDELIAIVQNRSVSVEERLGRMLAAAELEMEEDLRYWAGFLLDLERMDEKWADLLRKVRDASDIPELPKHDDCEIAFEQLMVYLLYRHIPGALQDDDLAGRIVFCALMWRILRAMVALRGFDLEEMVEICRMYSSEIEYSDENIGAILDELNI